MQFQTIDARCYSRNYWNFRFWKRKKATQDWYRWAFFKETTKNTRKSLSFCLKLVEIVLHLCLPKNSRILLQSNLMKISFWKGEKTNSTFIFTFFTLQWDYSWLFFRLQLIQSHQEKKNSKITIVKWVNALRFVAIQCRKQ